MNGIVLPKQDERYGKLVGREVVDDGERTFVVSIIDQRGECWLDIRSIYFKGGEPRFGKGVRIPDNLVESILAASEALAITNGLIVTETEEGR